jgi:transcriptional regulator with XRE-family HTH domain
MSRKTIAQIAANGGIMQPLSNHIQSKGLEKTEMKSLAEILRENFERLRDSGAVIARNAAAEAEFLGISASHLSRLLNGKVPLTDRFIDKLASYFAKEDREYKEKVRAELNASKEEKPANRPFEIASIFIEEVGNLFDTISHPRSLLCVDYRDKPQAGDRGAYPKLAGRASEAVAKGLSFAMFQPFGTPEAIAEKLRSIATAEAETETEEGYVDYDPLLPAYTYLYQVASEVRRVYYKMRKKAAEEQGKGQVVLYEANYKDPSIFGCGISSRLFYVSSYAKDRHTEKFYEWVVGASKPEGEHYFIERDNRSIDLAAIRQQFHPIPDYWLKNDYRLPENNDELEAAYNAFKGISNIEQGGLIWKVLE